METMMMLVMMKEGVNIVASATGHKIAQRSFTRARGVCVVLVLGGVGGVDTERNREVLASIGFFREPERRPL